MLSPDYKPTLRWPLSIQQQEANGKQFLIITDEQGLSENPIVVPAALAPLLSRFDGTNSIAEIVKEGAPYGVTDELVQRLIGELDALHYLDTPGARTRWEELKSQYREQDVRAASHVGAVYPSNDEALREKLQEYVAGAEAKPFEHKTAEQVIALIAPHIDYNRGWKTYGAGYSILEQMDAPDVIFLIGTAHQPGEGIFHLTDKGFETPFGVVPAARDVIEDLANAYGKKRAFQSEILHRREHSLELQMPFIAHRYADNGFPSLVPILVGSFHHFLVDGTQPIDSGEVGDFVGALSESIKALRDSGRNVLFYGGVDLAHVGTHFGDHERVSDNGLEEIRHRDEQLLDAILAADESALFSHIAEDLDRRRVCGFPSIYTMLSALKRAGLHPKGTLIEYRQAVEPQSDCIVTFASACWTIS